MRHSLPDWMERLLGIEAAEAGEGTVWRLDHVWSWAPWVTVLFLIAAALLVFWLYRQESSSAGRFYKIALGTIRLSLIGIVLIMLAELALSLERTGLPYVVVVLDDSRSMSIVDHYDDKKLNALIDKRLEKLELEEPSRFNLAKSVLLSNEAELLEKIKEDYKLRVYFVSSTTRAQAGDAQELAQTVRSSMPEGDSTLLGDGIRTVLNDLRGTPPTAIVLISDGINTAGEPLLDVTEYAKRKGVPLFTVAVGDDEPARDIQLHDLLVDEIVFVDDTVNFEFKLTATGLEGSKAKVVLREESSDTPLAAIETQLGPDGEPQNIRLPYRPTEVGEFRYTVEVEPLDKEINKKNNTQSQLVSVRKEKIRVLLVQSYPNYEFRYLKTMLDRDSTIELDTFLQEADPDYAELDQTALRVFPVQRDELFSYDVIIFGDVNPVFLGERVMHHLVDFVSESGKGGGMIFIAGPRHTPADYHGTPLAKIMPVYPASGAAPASASGSDEYQPRPSDLGLGSPHMQLGDSDEETLRIWENLPGLYWMDASTELKPGARVLAQHPTRITSDGAPIPIISLHYVGSGKVLYHATDETWRWRRQVGDVFFARYWVQAIRFLSRSKLLGQRTAELTTDRRTYLRGESVRLRARFVDDRRAPVEDDGVTVIVEREGEQNRRIKLHRTSAGRGVFEGVLSRPADGSYHAWIATPTIEGTAPATDFQVTAPPGELAEVQVDSTALQTAAEGTSGKFYTIANVSRLSKDLPRGRQIPVETLPRIELWNRWPLMLLFVGLITTEWILRKRKGML